MTKILEEVRAISSSAIAEKQDSAKNKFPEIIEQIKKAAALGKTKAEFPEYEINQYTKKLLEVEGFHVWATSKQREYTFDKYNSTGSGTKSIWEVSW